MSKTIVRKKWNLKGKAKPKAKPRTGKAKPKPKPKPRPSRPSMDVTGLSLDNLRDVVDQSGGHLTKGDLKKIASRLRQAANKRLNNLEKSGKADRSVAYQNRKERYKRNGKGHKKGDIKPKSKARRFTYKKGATRNELMHEVTELLNFLNRKSSTVKGTNEILANFEKEIGHFENDDQIGDFFDLYHRMLEELGISRAREDEKYMGYRKVFYNLLYPDGEFDENANFADAMAKMRKIIEQEEAERLAKIEETEGKATEKDLFKEIPQEDKEDDNDKFP